MSTSSAVTWPPRIEASMCFPKDRAWRLLVLMAVFVSASTRAQSLGEVAKAERAKPKKSATKVIREEDLEPTWAAGCDRDCEASVRAAIESKSKTKMIDPVWKARFKAGLDQLKDDDEWQTIYLQLRQRCIDKGSENPQNSSSTRDLVAKLALKVLKETNETLKLISEGVKSLGSSSTGPDQGEELAVKTVKLGIMSLRLDQLQQRCPTS